MDRSDAVLVEQCLLGNRGAFEVLVKRHQDAVFHLALRWTGDRDDASDLAQETFVRAYRKLRTYDASYAFRNWILTICANQAKNRIRSNQRRRRAQETHVELFSPTVAHPDPRRDDLERALAAMKRDMRVPLVLKHVEGLSYEEISKVLGIGVSAAKMRVKRARDELVRQFQTFSAEEN